MQNNLFRIAALMHEALGTSRIKVIFREGGRDNREGVEAAYFMTADTYRHFPLVEEVTLADFQRIAAENGTSVDEAQSRDIYSNI